MAFSSRFNRSISAEGLHSLAPLLLALALHGCVRRLAFILSDIPPLSVDRC
jgi:hypothetical protein